MVVVVEVVVREKLLPSLSSERVESGLRCDGSVDGSQEGAAVRRAVVGWGEQEKPPLLLSLLLLLLLRLLLLLLLLLLLQQKPLWLVMDAKLRFSNDAC